MKKLQGLGTIVSVVFILLLLLIVGAMLAAAWETLAEVGVYLVRFVLGVAALAGLGWLSKFLYRQFTHSLVAHSEVTIKRNEARLSDMEISQAARRAELELAAMAAMLPQLRAGLIYPQKLGDIPFASHTRAVAQLNDGTPLLGEPVIYQWPQMVRLFDLLPNRRGDVNNIVFGISLDENTGRQTVIKVPLEDMVHEASGGETGTGKSTLAYAIAYQLATAKQDVKLVLADPAGTTWKTLSNSDRLMHPVIGDNHNEMLGVLTALLQETERRTNELFAPYPTVEKLSEYNAIVGFDKRLDYIAMMIDEFPEYMENRDIEILFKRLIRKSRKAGVYIFAMGTSWKATDMDTSIKRQFRTKIHFAASDPQSSHVLLGSRQAADIKEPGRAYARLPFSTAADLVEIQCVYLDKHDIVHNDGVPLSLLSAK
jgi:DNA segregation ATPase FtsK/SpoIIIE-like protein